MKNKGLRKSLNTVCREEVGRSMSDCCLLCFLFSWSVHLGVKGSHASEGRTEEIPCVCPGMLIDVFYLGIEKLWLASLASILPFKQSAVRHKAVEGAFSSDWNLSLQRVLDLILADRGFKTFAIVQILEQSFCIFICSCGQPQA